MDQRWKRAAIIAALLVGAPAYAQQHGTTSSQGTPGTERGTSTTSSGQATGSSGSAKSAGAQAAPKGDLEKKIQELHAANEAEVQLGQVGSQQAQSPDVKRYAEKLSRDHQKNDEKLQQIAQTMGANLEGKAFQEKQKSASKDLAKLQQKQGHEFDKAFIDHMVKDHEKDVKEVEKAAKEARKQNQPELAAFFETTHTGLQGHLQEAQRIQKSLKQQSGSRSSQMGTGSGAAGATGTTSGGTSTTPGAPSGNSPQTGSSGSTTSGHPGGTGSGKPL